MSGWASVYCFEGLVDTFSTADGGGDGSEYSLGQHKQELHNIKSHTDVIIVPRNRMTAYYAQSMSIKYSGCRRVCTRFTGAFVA